MIVKKVNVNIFDREAEKKYEQPQSTRIVNTQNNVVRVVESSRMPVTRTTRRHVEEVEHVKTIEDFQITPMNIKWSSDYNILNVHTEILNYLKKRKEQADVIKKTINSYRSSADSKMSTADIASLRIKIEEMEMKVSHLRSLSLMEYKVAVTPILSEYKTLSAAVPRVFGQKEKINSVEYCRKSELVSSYFDIAKNYYPMNITRTVNTDTRCTNCSGNIIKDGEHYRCVECDCITHILEIQEEHTDYEEPTSKKFTNEDTSNYRDIVLQCAGTFPIIIPDYVIETIVETNSQYIDFDIKKMTKTDLLKTMKKLNMGLWYKHINKIYQMLTSIKPMDITKYIPNLYRRGDLLHEIYDKIKPENKTNFMHGLYLVWIFLKNEGCDPNMEDFCMLKSRSCEIENIDILTKGFEILRKTHPEFKWEIYQLP